jgi:hypothetical protein
MLSSSLKSFTTVTEQQLSSKILGGLERSSRLFSKGVYVIDETQSSSSITAAAAFAWALASAGSRVVGEVLEVGVGRCSLF